MVTDWINDWIRELLINAIKANLSGLFDTVNERVGSIAAQVGMTPAEWNGGIYNMIYNLSQTVMLPIAGVILAFVMTLELIKLITEKNNMHDVDTWMFYKWIFKTACAVLIVTNTWNIIMGVFDVAQSIVNSAAGVISGGTDLDSTALIADLETQLEAMDTGALLGLMFQSLIVRITTPILSVCIFVIIYGRMIEIYLVTSVAPIPMAMMLDREMGGGMGQSYLRSLFALGFQAFLILVCVAIYAVLVSSIAVDADIFKAIWTCMGYTILLCFTLFKTGSVAKSVFSAR